MNKQIKIIRSESQKKTLILRSVSVCSCIAPHTRNVRIVLSLRTMELFHFMRKVYQAMGVPLNSSYNRAGVFNLKVFVISFANHTVLFDVVRVSIVQSEYYSGIWWCNLLDNDCVRGNFIVSIQHLEHAANARVDRKIREYHSEKCVKKIVKWFFFSLIFIHF